MDRPGADEFMAQLDRVADSTNSGDPVQRSACIAAASALDPGDRWIVRVGYSSWRFHLQCWPKIVVSCRHNIDYLSVHFFADSVCVVDRGNFRQVDLEYADPGLFDSLTAAVHELLPVGCVCRHE